MLLLITLAGFFWLAFRPLSDDHSTSKVKNIEKNNDLKTGSKQAPSPEAELNSNPPSDTESGGEEESFWRGWKSVKQMFILYDRKAFAFPSSTNG